MEYTDTYHFLNQHLHTSPPKELTGIKNVYSIIRDPPTILRYQNELKMITMNIFKFSSKIFEQHQVNFPKHIVKIVDRSHKGFFRVINAFTLWGHGYYHFLTEVLPSVLEIAKPYTIHTMGSKFAQQIFNWFNIKNTLNFDKPTFENVKESYEQQYIECGNPSPQKIQLIRDVVCKKVSFTRTKGILIFRRETIRRILNSSEVLDMLKRIFPTLEWVIFDTLPFDETVTLFSSASIIVAPHGAGLTNMLFSDSGVQIIEFMSLQNPNICYWHLSELLKNKYCMIPCVTENGNFQIDIPNVEKLLTTQSL
jgi:hypothetical protein